MKKIIGLLLFAVIPTLMFSEVVFMPRIGLDVYKGIKSEALDNMMVKWINKALENGKDPNETVKYITKGDLPHSKPLITMITFGFDMQFISHGNGFTFFWNNEFGYAAGFQAYEKFTFLRKLPPLRPDDDIIKDGDKTFKENQKVMMLSTELLFGGTFRRESAFNINFGLGLRASVTPQTLALIKGLFNNQFPENNTVVAILPALGGTFGFTYYFNNVVGISASVSDFVSFGAFVAGKAEKNKTTGKFQKAVAFASVGLSNSFAMRLGLSLRVHGVRN
jgi:hypothetical protein